MFNEFDKVRIIETGVIGTIVDKRGSGDNVIYVVESDDEFPEVKGYGKSWPLFDCTENELERNNL